MFLCCWSGTMCVLVSICLLFVVLCIGSLLYFVVRVLDVCMLFAIYAVFTFCYVDAEDYQRFSY